VTQRISHWIDGRETPGTSGRTAPVYNPATGDQTGQVDFASTEDVAAAVAYLAGPQSSWVTGTHLVVDGGLTIRAHP